MMSLNILKHPLLSMVDKRTFCSALQKNFLRLHHMNILKRVTPETANIARTSRMTPHITMRMIKTFRNECRAVSALLHRSNISNNSTPLSILSNQFHTSSASHHQPPPFGPPEDSNKNKDKDKDPKKNKKDEEEDDKVPTLATKAFFWMLTAYIFIAMLSLLFPANNQPELLRYVSWNEFVYQMLAKGEVEELIVRTDIDVVTIVLYEGAVIKGKKVDQRLYHMNIVDIHKFEDKLRDAEKQLGVKEGVTVVYERGGDAAGKILITILVLGLLLSLLSRSKSIKTPISFDSFTQMGRAKFTLVDPLSGPGKGVKFEDVAGLKEAKVEVMEFVDYLKRPEYYKNLGAKVPKGALLLGPPGCGKTLLAKAVATEANVPFLSMNGSEFIEMIGGLGAARVRDLFKEANKRSPCIIYIDEIDAIGKKRSGLKSGGGAGTSGEGEQTLNQLLVEMDGMASKEGVIMLASTNRADVLDKALLRPGRFDRHILIDLPTMEERREIFERHLKGIVLEHEPSYYSNRMSYLSPGFSGADIANVCNEAALHAARLKQNLVTGADLEYAIERLVGGTEKRNHAMSQTEKKIVAYHESGHALVGWLLEHTDALLKVTIVPRTSLALGFAQYTPNDQKLYSKEELFDRMCMALGGRVAEALKFNSITTGAQNDLEKVTNMAYAQVKLYGMSENIGLLSFPEETKESGKSPYSKTLKNLIDLETRSIVAKAYYRTEELLRKNMDKLELMAQSLLAKETLNYEEVQQLIGPPKHGSKRLIEPVQFEMSLREASKPGERPKVDREKNKNENRQETNEEK